MKKLFTFVYEFLRGGWSFLFLCGYTKRGGRNVLASNDRICEITKIECE